MPRSKFDDVPELPEETDDDGADRGEDVPDAKLAHSGEKKNAA